MDPVNLSLPKNELVLRPCSKAVGLKHLQSTTNLENFLEIMGQKYDDDQKSTTIVGMALENRERSRCERVDGK